MSRLSHQAILNLTNRGTVSYDALRGNLQDTYGMRVPVIHGDTPSRNAKLTGLNSLDKHSQLFITGHGASHADPDYGYTVYSHSYDTITNTDDLPLYTWNPSQLADLLAAGLSQDLKGGANQQKLFSPRLTINLIICYAGMSRENSHLNSLAAKLQHELARRDIYVDVKAHVTSVSIERETGEITTTKIGEEANLDELIERKKAIIDEYNEATNSKQKRKLLQQAIEIINKEDSLIIRNQANASVHLKWTTNSDGSLSQVAYDALELQRHEADYQHIKELIQSLRDYADDRENKPSYTNAVNVARSLADNLEKETESYFNGTDKGKERTKRFKANCLDHIKIANKTLGNHRDGPLKRIIGKITLAVTSVLGLSVPFFIHRYLMNKGVFSTGLFSNRTRGQQLTDSFTSSLSEVKPLRQLK